jgi:Ca2+-binding RTX toxin-like protein
MEDKMTNYTFELIDGSTTYSGLIAGDTITFGAGLTFDTFSFLKDGNDLLVYTNNGATIRLTDQFLGTPLVHDLLFASGDTIPLNVSDALFGTTHDASLTGTVANDTIYGGISHNVLNGGDGDDTIYGGYNTDTINGGNGNDTIYAGADNDYIIGSTGSDFIDGGEGHDYLDFQGMANGIDIHLLHGTVTNGTDTTTLNSIEEVSGSNFADKIVGSHNEDALSGEAGDDLMKGRQGNDWIDGGSGNDEIYGNKGDDTLYGGSGDDFLYGGFGSDFLNGGSGTDMLHGRNGADTFAFDSSSYANIDQVLDFTLSDNDAIDVSALLNSYDALTDAITDFIQITDNGTDSFVAVDQDGSGSSYGFQQVAQLNGITGLDEITLEANGNIIT